MSSGIDVAVLFLVFGSLGSVLYGFGLLLGG
jgi:hypothetical protein